MSLTKHFNCKINGFTLVEILVALLVLAFGLLGLASLQLFGLRNNQTSYNRSQTTQLAYDIVDRIRANPLGFNNDKYNNKAASADDCLANSCTPTQVAGFDLKQWNDEIALRLPLGKGIVCKDSTPTDGTMTTAGVITHACDNIGNIYAVKIWYDERKKQGNTIVRFVMSFQI